MQIIKILPLILGTMSSLQFYTKMEGKHNTRATSQWLLLGTTLLIAKQSLKPVLFCILENTYSKAF